MTFSAVCTNSLNTLYLTHSLTFVNLGMSRHQVHFNRTSEHLEHLLSNILYIFIYKFQCHFRAHSSIKLSQHKLTAHVGMRYPCNMCDFTASKPAKLKVKCKFVNYEKKNIYQVFILFFHKLLGRLYEKNIIHSIFF